MICSKCSGIVPDGSSFCNHCGKRLVPAPRTAHKSRGNGQGCAFKSPNGRSWTAQAVVGYHASEKEGHQPIPIKRKKSGFPTKAAALAYVPILFAGGIEKPTSSPRLSEYWKTFSENRMLSLSKSKQTAYKIAWEKLKRIKDIHVDALTVQLLQDTVNNAAETYYPRRDCKALLSALFKLAAADGFANKDLPSMIELPSLEETEREPFTQAEQEALWKSLENGEKIAAIPLVMIYTGMMPGELQSLKKGQIDLSTQQIIGAGMKTKVRKKTPITIPDCLVPVMEDLMENAQPSGYILPRGKKEFYDRYYAALDAAGCRRLSPYSCRHTTATALAVTENIAPQTIRKLMRWSTTKMLDRYAHPDQSDALAAANKLKAITTKLPPPDAGSLEK